MNAFERYGITHLSASSLALYRNEPALWCLRYLHGIKDEAGASAWRGTAVEAAVDKILFENCTEDDAIAAALQTFEMNAEGEVSDEIEKERAVIPDMVRQAANLMRPMGMPVARQYKIEHWLDGIEIPVIGYVDYVWPDNLVDLKTTLRMPSEPKFSHVAQVGIYIKGAGRKGHLAYVTPKKSAVYPVEAIDDAMWAVHRGARAIRALLSRCETKEEASAFFSPNFESFYWNDASKKAAMEVYA